LELKEKRKDRLITKPHPREKLLKNEELLFPKQNKTKQKGCIIRTTPNSELPNSVEVSLVRLSPSFSLGRIDWRWKATTPLISDLCRLFSFYEQNCLSH